MNDTLPRTLHVVDDDAPFRRSLCFLLESVGWRVVGHASAEDFLTACPEPAADIACLILDVRMPLMSGLELQRALLSRGWQVPMIFITGHGDVELAVQAMKRGASDFLEKPFKDQALIDAVAEAVRNAAALRCDSEQRRSAKARIQRLSPREREVARLVAQGLPNKLIANQLAISVRTVHVHRQSLMGKAEVGSAAELARLMLQADPHALD